MKTNLLLLILVFFSNGDEFDDFKAEMEQKVMGLAKEMQSIYARRCDSDIVECEIKSINWCQGTGKKECFDDYPSDPSCLTSGSFLSDQSAFRFPNSVDPMELTNQDRQLVCASAFLDAKLQQLNINRNNLYSLAYFGTKLGSLRVHPANFAVNEETGECPDFDPRFRPWYTSGSSGAKNVVIIIDISGSMKDDKIQIAKEAAKSVINTFGNNDFVGVVKFSDEAQTLYTDKLSRATNELKAGINQQIDKIEAFGNTNYEKAFVKALKLVNSAEADEYGAPCGKAENVFLFLTDGAPKMGADTSEELIQVIDDLNSRLNMKLFTYALGSDADLEILKDLSCYYRGIMFQLEDQREHSELITQMREYYEYLAEGVQISYPVWTEPYDDAFDAGRMVTVSMPVYNVEGEIKKVLGVIGIDVVMDTFYNSGFNDEAEIVKELIKNAPCQTSSLTDCDIENLRPLNSQCGISGCSQSNYSEVVCNTTTTNIFIDAVTQDTNLCCSITVGGFVAIIVVILVVIAAVVLGCYCWRRYQKDESQQEPKYQSGREIKIGNDGKARSGHKNSMVNPNPFFNQPPSSSSNRFD